MKLRTEPFGLQFKFSTRVGHHILNLASEPFGREDLQRRPLMTTKDKEKGKPAYYIDTRALDARLNLVFGDYWSVTSDTTISDGDKPSVIVAAEVRIFDSSRSDVSAEAVTGDPNLAVTSAFAAAFKRAAAKFGIAAYLYDLKDVTWLPLKSGTSFFKDPYITDAEWNALPAFAKPVDIKVTCMNYLQQLFDTTDVTKLKEEMTKYFNIDSIKNLTNDDAWRLTVLVANMLDYLDTASASLEDLYTMVKNNGKTNTLGFKNG